MKPFLLSGAIICLCLLSIAVFGQPGISEMQQARQDLTSTFFSTFDLSLVIAGIFGIAGAVRIYYNLQLGRERMVDAIAAWIFAAFFIIIAGIFLRALFGI